MSKERYSGSFRIELPDAMKPVLDMLVDETGVPKRKDAVVCAISNLVWMLEKVKNGHRVIAESNGAMTELEASYLAKARLEAGTKHVPHSNQERKDSDRMELVGK